MNPRSLAYVGLATLLWGCEGLIGEALQSRIPAAEEEEGVCQPGVHRPLAVPLARINGAQYNDVVADLFGPTVLVPNNLPPSLGGYPYTTYSAANPTGDAEVQAFMEAAEAIAIQVADLVPACGGDESGCASDYLAALAGRAFRQPATSDELAIIMSSYTSARESLDYRESVAVGVETILQMPQFLYILEDQPDDTAELTGREIAQRLALLFWNGLPDTTLLAAADSGALADPDARRTEARRLIADPRARDVLTDFLLQWMTIRGFRADVHSPDVQAALAEEMRRDIARAIDADDGVQELLASTHTYVNSVLETFYGLPSASTGPDDWREVDLDPEVRVGILTHPLLLAKFAHDLTPSPIFRGKFIRMMVMCDDIPPPPPGAQEQQGELAPPDASPREQSQARINSPVCGACHSRMDPIGFGFSAFDGAGHYHPDVADRHGNVLSDSDLSGDFDGVRALGDKLAQSPKVRSCLATQWLRYSFGKHETIDEACTAQELADRFAASGGSLTELFAELAALDTFAVRGAPPVAATEVSP